MRMVCGSRMFFLWFPSSCRKIVSSRTLRNFSTENNVVKSKGKWINLSENTTIADYLWRNLEKYSSNIAVECLETQRRYSYKELHSKSLSITNFLKSSVKLKHQDTACIVLPNIPEYPIILLGAVQAGLKVTTCNPAYTADEIQRQLAASKSSIVFTSNALYQNVKAAVGQHPIPIVVVNHDQNNFIEDTIDFNQVSSGIVGKPADVNIQDVAVLPYSSGTTGLPKGVQLTHRNIVYNLLQTVSDEFNLQIKSDGKSQDVIPAFLPFFHIYGLVIIMLNTLNMGNKLITVPTFNSDNFLRVIKEYKASLLYCVPLMVNLATIHPNLTVDDFKHTRAILSGAAPLGAADVQRFLEKTKGKVDILQGYGMTETSPLTLMQTRNLNNGTKIGGSGVLVPNTEAKIVPADGSTFSGLGTNESGELLIRGPQVMKGYLNNPKATSEVLLEDGWIRTGDIAHYDENEHFYITDRLKELIKVKGFQVAPAELEEILRDHPGIADAAVIGVPHPTQDEAPKAFVVLKKKNSMGALQVQEYVASKVSKHKQLKGGVVFVESIPKSASGKILRIKLKN